MKVKKTLRQIIREINELKEQKELAGRVIARSLVKENREHKELFYEYKHYDEVIEYLLNTEVEYEDKYETEVEED